MEFLVSADLDEMKKFFDEHPDFDINSVDQNGHDILLRIVSKKDEDIDKVKFLIEKGININKQAKDGMTALIAAAFSGKEETVKILLEKGADPNLKFKDGKTALIAGAAAGSLGIVKSLVEKGAELNPQDDKGTSALLFAVDKEELEIVKFLIEKGADVNLQEKNGTTSLMLSVRRKNDGIFKLLIDNGADLNKKSKIGKTPLMMSLERNDVFTYMPKTLIEKGADIELKDNNGRTVLFFATIEGNLQVVQILVNKGANLEVTDKNDINVLMLAAQGGFYNVIKIFLEKGADLNKKDKHGDTALIYAARGDREDIVKVLAEKGAEVNAQNNGGWTALMYAAEYSGDELVKLLLDNGADLKIKDKDGSTALSHAIVQGWLPSIKFLIEKGANINEKDNIGRTPLIYAVKSGKLETVKFLSEKGADLNIKTKYGENAIIIAIMKSKLNIVEFFLEKGVDVNEMNDEENTLLMYAASNGNSDIVKLLINKGAEINAKNKDGMTALMVALDEFTMDDEETHNSTYEEVIEILLKKGADVNIKNNNGKSVVDYARDGDYGEHVSALILSYVDGKEVPYKGTFNENMKLFDVFLAIPDYPENATEEQKKKAEDEAKNIANNASLCPVCLSFASRQDGCLYMNHKCPKQLRHDELYDKYKNNEGKIYWCTDCSRICLGHRHYELNYSGGKVPELLQAGDPFDKNCLKHGGGSIDEKLRRISRMIDFYAELQVLVDSGGDVPSQQEVRKMVIEETWNGAMIRTFVNPQSVKRWKTDLGVFPKEKIVSTQQQSELVVPPGSFEDPVLHKNHYSVIALDNCDAIQFKHKNNTGVMYDHKDNFICKDDLIAYLKSGGDRPGKCYDEHNCDGYLWPPEVRKAIELFGAITPEEEELLKKYEDRFPRTIGGGIKLPGLNTLFQPMDNEECVDKKGKGRRTLKNRRRPALTRRQIK